MKKEDVLNSAEYPMGLNRYMALKGYSTRRGADELIRDGIVYVNGKQAIVAQKVSATDKVEVRQRGPARSYDYFAYNKPVGVITHSPQDDEEDIKGKLGTDVPYDVFPLGRLDKNSYGLILLTNDGRITDRLLNPEYEHEKEYVVTTKLPLRESFKKYMEAGVNIEGYVTRPCVVNVRGDNEFSISLTEGKKHQIRRMVVALHNDVVSLKRTRIMNIKLGTLGKGSYRRITGDELKTFLEGLGLTL
jgi:23S rRNA pseudouridine2604 synthase